MSRFSASFYHLLISIFVFVCLSTLVLTVWYPDFFYTTDGGWEGMRIIIGVDLVLGPLLTLIVFKPGKPGLKFDLATIGTLQALCLVAGAYVIYQERPYFFIYYHGHFYSASADTFEQYNQQMLNPADYSDRTPAFVAALAPEDPIEEADLRAKLYKNRTPLWIHAPSYKPLDDHMGQVMKAGFPASKLRERDDEKQLGKWPEKHGGEEEDYAFFPVH